MIESHTINYKDEYKFGVQLKEIYSSKCTNCLCLDCDNGCHNIVCEALCKKDYRVIKCGDFDDDWY